MFDNDEEDDDFPPVSKILQTSHTKEPASERKARSSEKVTVSLIDEEDSDDKDIVAPGSSRRNTRIGQTSRRLVKRKEYRKVSKISFED
jgi:hypothetical protein